MDQTIIVGLNNIAAKLTDNKVAIYFEQITVSHDAIPLTGLAQYASTATSCVITTETNSIRWQEFGAPTTTVGHLAPAGSVLEFKTAQNLSSLLLIATGSDATINVTYYK
jgi:hypothetical protein